MRYLLQIIEEKKEALSKPNLKLVNKFYNKIKEAEIYFDTTFQTDKPAYISVSKGINKKTIAKWVKNRFVICEYKF